jgi:hypothetical protein
MSETTEDPQNSPVELPDVHAPDELKYPLIEVTFRWDEPEGQDSFLVQKCPWCGEEHYYNAYQNLTVALGGISEVECKTEYSGSEYWPARSYIVLQEYDANLAYEVVHHARQELMNLPGDKLNQPLVPVGVDPRVLDRVLYHWTSSP